MLIIGVITLTNISLTYIIKDRMNNIKKLREKKGIKQDELAKLLNVTQGAVSGWETGW